MKTLTEYFTQAQSEKWAIGHFNFSSADVLRAVVDGAVSGGAPCVMVGTSEGEADFLGMAEAVALVRAVRETTGFPVFLNADHFKSYDRCKAAIDAGYDSVLFDGGKLSYAENITESSRVWDYAQTVRGDFMVEGELGYLKGNSEVQEAVQIGPEDYTKPGQAAEFIGRTGVQRLAIVFGNIHGIVTKQEEHLDIGHLKTIASAVPGTFLVLHGASGVADDEVKAAIAAGITNVHFNTELRVAYTRELKEEIAQHPDQNTPYKYLGPAAAAVSELVAQKTRVFMAGAS